MKLIIANGIEVDGNNEVTENGSEQAQHLAEKINKVVASFLQEDDRKIKKIYASNNASEIILHKIKMCSDEKYLLYENCEKTGLVNDL